MMAAAAGLLLGLLRALLVLFNLKFHLRKLRGHVQHLAVLSGNPVVVAAVSAGLPVAVTAALLLGSAVLVPKPALLGIVRILNAGRPFGAALAMALALAGRGVAARLLGVSSGGSAPTVLVILGALARDATVAAIPVRAALLARE